ncbi:Gfo/Idh/MocA family oxidoreductase [Helicobacter kayseriensis]|uniref:Gfo/Idh/MocA family oxidoreductase n=1 Tax=Helicobacter kayseriensis TaxID=2905877 RepID=UPI001E56129A|nr:Gfo/Idh/MocA family oxidoreductase [Helicobacter kayseriensis]MCE3046731.1 Gfo/Idh/MocA family oxidoreductase [Helicobacter kayseriensis]MCE3047967.1 Gfo/Idh/MocA family oxidoreductase [Helicobacter kayseriensis]
MKRFAITGVGGFVAPRHLKAIKECGGEVVCALDIHDSVGIIDSYFPQAHFFTEFERFDRHIEKLKREKSGIHYLSICSPNYLHDAHMRLALRNGAHAICEKPLVLTPWNLDALLELEREHQRHIYTILQLRLHPKIIALKEKVQSELAKNPNKIFDLTLTYITSRGKWYFISWKGDESKSGGIASNIGIHFFDMLQWIFGEYKEVQVHHSTPQTKAGFLELQHARVKWFLSVDSQTLPPIAIANNKPTFRSLQIDENEFEFSDGFTDLHTESYKNIMQGQGFRAIEAKASIDLTYKIRFLEPICGDMLHPFLKENNALYSSK